MTSLDGRVAFVTGGAHGIGRACVERLQAAGAAVVFCDIEPDAGREVAEALTNEGLPVEFVEADVTVEDQMARATAFAIERFGSLDVVVANAGIDRPFDAATMTEEEWDAFVGDRPEVGVAEREARAAADAQPATRVDRARSPRSTRS